MWCGLWDLGRYQDDEGQAGRCVRKSHGWCLLERPFGAGVWRNCVEVPCLTRIPMRKVAFADCEGTAKRSMSDERGRTQELVLGDSVWAGVPSAQ